MADLSLVISDWGTSGSSVNGQHYGGTPIYATGNSFNSSGNKDIFAYGQIAAELYLEQSGNLTKSKNTSTSDLFLLIIKTTILT